MAKPNLEATGLSPATWLQPAAAGTRQRRPRLLVRGGSIGPTDMRGQAWPLPQVASGALRAYTCRGCGTSVSYPGTFRKCPVCGIKWG
jgi:hypothetical protein